MTGDAWFQTGGLGLGKIFNICFQVIQTYSDSITFSFVIWWITLLITNTAMQFIFIKWLHFKVIWPQSACYYALRLEEHCKDHSSRDCWTSMWSAHLEKLLSHRPSFSRTTKTKDSATAFFRGYGGCSLSNAKHSLNCMWKAVRYVENS